MLTENYQVGDQVYYTGDMANHEGFGRIVKRREADRFAPVSYDIELMDDDGETRLFRGVYHLGFQSGPGRRFWLRSEWSADQDRRMQESIARMQRVIARAKGGA